MRTGSALLHRWSAALEEYDFTVSIVQGRPRPMLMGSVGCRSIQRYQKMCSSIFASWKMRKRRKNSRQSSNLPLISADKHYGSSSATGMILNPVAAFAWKSHSVVPSVRWGAIMATVRRRQVPYSPEGHGIRSPSTLWDFYPPTTDRSSSSCLWIATRGTPSFSPLATTPQTR